ncbi:class I SAM-dependent methyltransferase [Flavobacterium salilacus subsp. salilacus]|uniref:class I SAM-dependent methyltransferase n=1 Tax=Flavobacterium TaxID=237 RepID=UPI0010753848|nr:MULTISPECIES: class I SAM-dependent methyltransferase [Flavobacterium]KAF2518988.1 class I SAM-dependent methyltransferase [Flavobacterium salilacus subsp. salilacus]MBE1614849.1 class I SAM-dependent methyltransferase [Flavobacterium sp. SaA2.13]
MDISEFSRLNNKNRYSRHPWETSRKNVLHKLLKSYKIPFPIERVVDIGAGDAYVIHTLLHKGIGREYIAIDTAYTPEVISQLKENYGNSPVQYVQDIEEYKQKYGNDVPTLFLCMDVLEHVQDESIILSHLGGNSNHIYFFAVPAFQSVFSGHDALLGHYRRYTLLQLQGVLANYGFTVKDRGYYFMSLLMLRRMEKIFTKNKKESIDNWAAGKFKTGLINTVLKIDADIGILLKKAGITIPGLSCYCLCKK